LFEGITTGAITGNQFYFVANTQLRKMSADGSVPTAAQFNPLHVLRVSLNSTRP